MTDLTFPLAISCGIYNNYEEFLLLCDVSPACICLQELILGNLFCCTPALHLFFYLVSGLQNQVVVAILMHTCLSHSPIIHLSLHQMYIFAQCTSSQVARFLMMTWFPDSAASPPFLLRHFKLCHPMWSVILMSQIVHFLTSP